MIEAYKTTDALDLAVPVGRLQIEIVHMDTSVERFGRFETGGEAVEWAMMNRVALGLDRCSCWRVEAINGK